MKLVEPSRIEVKSLLASYRGARWSASLLQLALTLTSFVALWIAMWWTQNLGYACTLLLAVPTAGLAMRLFILQHDCGHGSFFASPRANRLTGLLLSGITLTPYQCWRRQHAAHHATNGQLDHRGIGDITTLTVAEYGKLSRWRRFGYRLYRNPLVLFGLGPIVHFSLLQRFTGRLPKSWTRERRSVRRLNVALAVVYALLAWLVGPWTFLKIHVPVIALAASAGAWLFYIQHQFDPAYWAHDDHWEFDVAAHRGSSFLDLPWPLRWFTANIGYHHIHHLDSRIPNYALPRCHDADPRLWTAPRLTLVSSLKCMHLKLWDEGAGRMVTFRAAGRAARQRLPQQ